MFYYMSTNYLLILANLTFLLATYFSQNSAGKTYQGLIAVQLSNHRCKTSHTSPRMMLCCFYTLPLPGTVCAVMQLFSALRLATYCDHITGNFLIMILMTYWGQSTGWRVLYRVSVLSSQCSVGTARARDFSALLHAQDQAATAATSCVT